ncbi:ESX-3 secretion system protein EccD3 [Mycobacterium talmoniae]|uniref:ESX-3 secretion system protein EccD3 n=1 Tax=Mycobacterium talmoniae TaxID=1858794 RepID=A0A2S8BHY3_9MYCO|nr:ESX-3 secretion system protein EccD3 [Mycobacterium talmoniae]
MSEAPVMSGAVMPIVRVAILAESRLSEIALPAELPLREILPAVQRLVAPDTDEAEPGADPVGAARLSLARSAARRSAWMPAWTPSAWSTATCCAAAGPGRPGRPRHRRRHRRRRRHLLGLPAQAWGTAHIQRGALAAVIGCLLAGTGLAVTHRVVSGGPIGLVAVAALAVLAVLASLVSRARSPRTAVALSIAALAPVAAALTLVVPGDFGPANVMLGAAGVTAWALVSMILPDREDDRAVAFFTATMVVGAGVLLAAGAATLWHLSYLSLGCGLLAAALLITISAAQLSALWARFPLPVIPAPVTPPVGPVDAGGWRICRAGCGCPTPTKTASSPAGAAERAGTVAVAARPETVAVVGWYLVGAVGLASILRARVWDSAACKAWLLAQPFLAAAVLLVCYAATGRYLAAGAALLVLAVLVLVWAVAALNPTIASPDSYSLPMRRLVGFLASTLDASLIPVMAYLVGLFTLVLNR